MPQLDFTIAFPQIFWLLFSFFFLYTILVHFFLPKFIQVLRSRKELIAINNKLIIDFQNQYNYKHKKLNLMLNKNIKDLKLMLQLHIYPFFLSKKKNDLQSIDIKISKALLDNILYSDKIVFESISLKSMHFTINK